MLHLSARDPSSAIPTTYRMEPRRWERIQHLFLEASALPDEARRAFLERECADAPDVRVEVEALLDADALEAGWLDETRRTDWRAAAFSAALSAAEQTEQIPEHIGPYRVTGLLGRGGMGTVYDAFDDHLGRAVAIKVIRPGLDSDDILRRFRGEQTALARLEHPGIARLYDAGRTEDGRPYFVMERIDGQPLTAYAEARDLSLETRLRLFQQVCTAVHAAHTRLVLHRDLKPSNILVTEDDDGEQSPSGRETHARVKLLDFGLARALAQDGQARTLTVTTLGLRRLTPQYASPEQILGHPLSTASDVYSLGVVLFELLTGARPHQATSGTMAEWMRIMAERPMARRPSEAAYEEAVEAGCSEREAKARRRLLQGELDAIVLKALEPEPTDRYGSAEQLGADVRRYLRREPILARAPTWRYRLRRWQRQARPYVKYMVAAAFVALLGVIAMLWIGPVDRNPVTFDIDGDYLRIQNAGNETIETIHRPLPGGGDRWLTRAVWTWTSFYDLDGDGQNEVFWLSLQEGPQRGVVHAKRIGAAQPLWSVPLDLRLDYPHKAGTAGTNYKPHALLVDDLDEDGAAEAYVAATLKGSFPTVVLQLDARTGHEAQRYVHSGALTQLDATDVDGDGRRELLAAGTSNAFGDIVLAALDPEDMQGHGPERGAYAVEDYALARHVRYLRFPPTEVSRQLLSTRNRLVTRIRNLGQAGLTLSIREGLYLRPDDVQEPLAIEVKLTPQLTVRDVNTENHFDAFVELMAEKGRLEVPMDRAYWQDWMDRVQSWTGDGWISIDEWNPHERRRTE